MIKVKVLGPIKDIIGKNEFNIETSPKKLKDIIQELSSLTKQSSEKISYDEGNLLIMINGVESSILGNEESIINDGDELVLIPVIHGGHILSSELH